MFETAALNALLAEELACGNAVAEVSDWPPTCRKLVILDYRFARAYADAALEYAEVNDPHYWFAEYRAGGGAEVLACRFGVRPA